MSSFDISETLAPDSAQLDAVDLLGGARVFIIESVSKGAPDQPVNVYLTGFPRPWRPGKSMRRVLAACWGTDASAYVGRRVELFCDPTVIFGGAAVGGIRIRALSHIGKRIAVPLLISRGKSAMYTVEPLPDAPDATQPTLDEMTGYVESTSDLDELRDLWAVTAKMNDPAAARALITARKAELTAGDS